MKNTITIIWQSLNTMQKSYWEITFSSPTAQDNTNEAKEIFIEKMTKDGFTEGKHYEILKIVSK